MADAEFLRFVDVVLGGSDSRNKVGIQIAEPTKHHDRSGQSSVIEIEVLNVS